MNAPVAPPVTPIARWLERLRMRPVSPEALAVSRVAFFGWLLAMNYDVDTAAWAPFAELDFRPPWLFHLLGVKFASASVLRGLDLLWVAALLAATVGLATRVSMGVCFLLGTYLMGLPHSVGKIHHSDAIMVFALAAFALSRAGDAWSVDGLIEKKRGRTVVHAPSPEYAWPLWFGLFCIVVVYFSAGVAKLRASGFEWVTGEGGTTRFLSHQYTHEPPTSLGMLAARLGAFGHVANGFALALEVLSPLALLHRYPRVVILAGLFTLQISIYLTLGVFFKTFFALFAMCVPWLSLSRQLRQAALRARRSLVPSDASRSV